MPCKRRQIMDQFVDGLMAGLRPSTFREDPSEHWKAGYAAGYALRPEKNRLLDEYLSTLNLRSNLAPNAK